MVSFILMFYFYLKYRKFTKLKKNVINYDVIVEITSCVPQTSSLLLSHEYLSMFRAFDVLLEVPQKQTNFMFFFQYFTQRLQTCWFYFGCLHYYTLHKESERLFSASLTHASWSVLAHFSLVNLSNSSRLGGQWQLSQGFVQDSQ